MRKIETKTTYQTSDGRKFVDKEKAERYEALSTAKRDYEQARRRLGRLLAEGFRTADGKPFEFGVLHDYWWIHPGHSDTSLPRLIRVSFYCDNWDWKEAAAESTRLILLVYRDDDGEKYPGGREYPIDELYADQRVAAQAVRAAQLAWLKRRLEEMETGKPS